MGTASPPDAGAGMPTEESIARALVDFQFEGAGPESVEAHLPMARAILALIRPAFEAKEREIAEWQREAVRAQSKLRWNIDDEGRLVRLCDGEHDKGEPCEFTTYVPEQDLCAAEAKLAQAVEALESADRYLMSVGHGDGTDGARIRRSISELRARSASEHLTDRGEKR
jgi:hypothetical protein